MELENLEKRADCTAGLVAVTGQSEARLFQFQSNQNHSPRSCGRRALIAGLVVAFAFNTFLTLIAIAFTAVSLQAATEARAENGELREKLHSQKELLATILNALTGTDVTREEAEVTESARAALLGKDEDSNPENNQFRRPASLLNDVEGGGVSNPAGPGIGTGGDGGKNGASSAGDDGESRLSNVNSKATRRRTRRNTHIQECDCTKPNAGRLLNGCCCKRLSNNTETYNSTVIDRFRQILNGRAAGHFVGCNPSLKDLAEKRPAGDMVAYNLFRSHTRDIFLGDEEPWSSFPASRAVFEFDPLKATLTIKQDGLYFIYAHVAHALFTESSLMVNSIEWLRCQHRPSTGEYTLSPYPKGRESCNMYGVRPLLAGDKLIIQNGVAGIVAEVTLPQCTNFGIVKL